MSAPKHQYGVKTDLVMNKYSVILLVPEMDEKKKFQYTKMEERTIFAPELKIENNTHIFGEINTKGIYKNVINFIIQETYPSHMIIVDEVEYDIPLDE